MTELDYEQSSKNLRNGCECQSCFFEMVLCMLEEYIKALKVDFMGVVYVMDNISNKEFLDFLLERFKIERDKFDRSGVYAYTQRLLAYNSNKIEGSTLTEEQTASLFEYGTLPKSDDYYRAKDVEEMNGHFLMFNKMLDTLGKPLSQELIKQFHYELKSGVFEDRANGYAIGEYKKRPNMIGMYQTVRPEDVVREMHLLMDWYSDKKVDIPILAEFHARYESIHPFQDGKNSIGQMNIISKMLSEMKVKNLTFFNFKFY